VSTLRSFNAADHWRVRILSSLLRGEKFRERSEPALITVAFVAEHSSRFGIDNVILAAGVARQRFKCVVVRLGWIVSDPALDAQTSRRTAK
jgi:hypothetical protein